MSDSDVAREEEANQQRKAEQEARDGDTLIGSAERAVGAVLKPLTTERLDAEDVEERREENDQEQRPA